MADDAIEDPDSKQLCYFFTTENRALDPEFGVVFSPISLEIACKVIRKYKDIRYIFPQAIDLKKKVTKQNTKWLEYTQILNFDISICILTKYHFD